MVTGKPSSCASSLSQYRDPFERSHVGIAVFTDSDQKAFDIHRSSDLHNLVLIWLSSHLSQYDLVDVTFVRLSLRSHLGGEGAVASFERWTSILTCLVS